MHYYCMHIQQIYNLLFQVFPLLKDASKLRSICKSFLIQILTPFSKYFPKQNKTNQRNISLMYFRHSHTYIVISNYFYLIGVFLKK